MKIISNMTYHRIKQIKKIAGRQLLESAIETFGSKSECERWFNSPAYGLGNNTPYEFCRQGKRKEVSNLIGRIEYGVYS